MQILPVPILPLDDFEGPSPATVVAGMALLGIGALAEGDFESLSDLAGACLDFLPDCSSPFLEFP